MKSARNRRARISWVRVEHPVGGEARRVSVARCEEVLLNGPYVVKDDRGAGERYFALGRTDEPRLVFLVFEVRQEMIRVLAAREMTASEREVWKGVVGRPAAV